MHRWLRALARPVRAGWRIVRRRGGTERSSAPVSPEAVRWAYRLLLDRDPESQHVVDEKARLPDIPSLRSAFLESDEFRGKNAGDSPATVSSDRNLLDVEVDVAPAERARLLALTTETWAALGESDPHWSVLSDEQFRAARIDESIDRFRDSGRGEVARHVRLLRSNGVDRSAILVVTEYGCGVGRVTRWLAEEFERVHACDISASHLEHARRYLREVGRDNVELHRIASLDTLTTLPKADLVYTLLVLQHNPPPIIAATLRGLLDSLAPGGVALFQLPTYAERYRFAAGPYLEARARRRADQPSIEMHLLPQRHVFRIVREAGCEPLEVLEDRSAGPGFVSNTFLVRRP